LRDKEAFRVIKNKAAPGLSISGSSFYYTEESTQLPGAGTA
jgi:hypothetical protein